jgi:hypothetical protein
MNITELTGPAPEWWVPVVVSIPSTIVMGALIYAGKGAWLRYRKRVNARHWNDRYGTA